MPHHLDDYPKCWMLFQVSGTSYVTLAEKKLILVSQSKNNTYYLPNYLHVHPYLFVSEKTHEFIGSVRKQVNERELTLWIQEVVKCDGYMAYNARLQKLHERCFPYEKFAEKETLDSYI
jgi:hypothetical protein